ncbi:MAG: hypothetical protein WAO91_04185 [Candidatus Nitrosotenuis sp.]
MTQNVLLWIDNGFIHYGITPYLQKANYKIFAIIDTYKSLKNFFQNQKLIPFEKTWYFYDYISPKKPDLDYLAKIEQKYGINIWSIAYTDRLFYNKFNQYYKFSYDEILSIIELECRFFEEVLTEIKPKYFLMNASTQHYQYLISKICSSLGITVLTLEVLRFGNRCMIANGTIYDLKDIPKKPDQSPKSKTIKEIRNFLDSNRPGQFYLVEKSYKKYTNSKSAKLKALLQFLFINNEESNQYRYFGRTRKNVLIKGNARIHLLKKKYRASFMKNNFLHTLDKNDELFVYFPLHLEPERVLLMGAPYYADQISVINNIAKSLPVGYKLYVKEHPVMETLGWRPKSFYKEIMDLPNVVMIHPSVTTEEIIKKSSLVITIRGTTSLEATFYGKPSIVFKEDVGYSSVPSIHILQNIEELPLAIKSSLNKKVEPLELSAYVDYIEENSFEFPSEKYSFEVASYFNYNVGYLKQIKITEAQIKSFIENFKSTFEMIANEYLKKMKN